MNSLVSELAVMVAQEKASIDECEALVTSMAAMQVRQWHKLLAQKCYLFVVKRLLPLFYFKIATLHLNAVKNQL